MTSLSHDIKKDLDILNDIDTSIATLYQGRLVTNVNFDWHTLLVLNVDMILLPLNLFSMFYTILLKKNSISANLVVHILLLTILIRINPIKHLIIFNIYIERWLYVFLLF